MPAHAVQEILIHRCTLRLVRRGGWTWGGDPRRIVSGAMRALPELIASRLAALWPADANAEISTPLRLRIPLRIEELVSAGSGSPESTSTSRREDAMEARVEQAIRTLIERECASATTANAEDASDAPDAQTPQHDFCPDLTWQGTVLGVMLAWHRDGVLAARLASFSAPALEAWHESLLKPAGGAGARKHDVSESALLAHAQALSRVTVPLASARMRMLVQRLLIYVEAAARWRIEPGDALLRRALDAAAPMDAADVTPAAAAHDAARPSEGERRSSTDEARFTSTAVQSPQQRPRARERASRLTAEVHAACALPFLMLGPLAGVGYLEAAAATLHAAGLVDELPAFATALARKVLAPPSRGWLRRSDAIASAAAFAGIANTAPDPRLQDFASLVAPHLSPLAALVGGALLDGHTAKHPLLIQQAPCARAEGYLLVDCEGTFALAWADRLPRLFASLASVSESVVLIPQTSATRELLRELDDAGFTFVTDAPPARREVWRRVRTTALSLRCWTNGGARFPDGKVEAAASMLESAAPEAAASWQALAIDRPACAPSTEAAFEVSLALAASFALGTIAWTLWRAREPTTPLLALDRFGDFDARVQFQHDVVKVRLPLGKRYSDLLEHGLLRDVHGVPWLGGRVVQFSGG